MPLPPSLQEDTVKDPNGRVPLDMSFKMTQMQPETSPGGTVRIADTRNFKIATEIAAALVEVQPGHMREIHWHPNSDEWQYYISGQARMTVFGAQTNSRTFDYRAGHVGYVPKSMPHFVENTGSEPLRFLELFNSPRYIGRFTDAVDGERAARTGAGASQYRPPDHRRAAEGQARRGVTHNVARCL